MTADLSSSGPSAPGVSELAEVLGAHVLGVVAVQNGQFVNRERQCSCGQAMPWLAPDGDHRRHVAEVIAASGVVVPAAKVEALAARGWQTDDGTWVIKLTHLARLAGRGAGGGS